jgi:hypothetical protein
MVSTIVPFNMVGLELSVSLDQCEPLKALYETVLPLTDILPSSVPACLKIANTPSSEPLFKNREPLPFADA